MITGQFVGRGPAENCRPARARILNRICQWRMPRERVRSDAKKNVSAFRRISTGQLSAFRYTHLHLRPINLLVLKVPYSLEGTG
jgi:hypothetical protein